MPDAPDKSGDTGDKSAPGARRCPLCGKPTELAYRPFCSKRCADIDLGRWLGGGYAIPVVEEDEDEGEANPRPMPDE